jgi:hypothetical protein
MTNVDWHFTVGYMEIRIYCSCGEIVEFGIQEDMPIICPECKAEYTFIGTITMKAEQ